MRILSLFVTLLVACGGADDSRPAAGEGGAAAGDSGQGGDEAGEGEGEGEGGEGEGEGEGEEGAAGGEGEGGEGEGEGEGEEGAAGGDDAGGEAGGGVEGDCPPGDDVPQPVAEQVGIYDAERRMVVMVGGDAGPPVQCRPDPLGVGETWTFDTRCRTFERIGDESSGPGIRSRGLAVHDTKRDRMVMFGGRRQLQPGGYDYVVFNDLWSLALEFKAWGTMRSRGAAPSPRYSMAGGYDEQGDRLIVHGGNTSDNGLQYAAVGGTYALDFESQQWSLIENSNDGPGVRLNHAGAVDSEGGRLYLYGGSTDFFAPAKGDLWALDLATQEWTELAQTSPTAPDERFWPTMMFDPRSKKLFMFGGHDSTEVGNQNDTWSYDPATDAWENITPAARRNEPPLDTCSFPVDFVLPQAGVPERRSAHLSAFDSRRGEWLLFGGKTDCGIINDVWIFDPRRLAWSELFTATAGESCNRRDDVVQCVAMCHDPR